MVTVILVFLVIRQPIWNATLIDMSFLKRLFLFARGKLIGSAKIYWDLIVKDCVRRSHSVLGRNEKNLKKSTFSNIIGTVS